LGEDQREIAARLQEMGFYVLEVHGVRGRGFNPFRIIAQRIVNPIFGGASVYQMAVFYRQFGIMVRSGMTVGHALSSLSTQGGSRVLRKVAQESLTFVQSGGRLSEAFARYPWVFPELHISLLRAAETGGTMDRMLSKIADYLEREHGIRQRLRLATLYPKILVLAVIFIPRLPVLVLEGFDSYRHQTIGTLGPILAAVAALWVLHRLLSQIGAFRYVQDVVKLAAPRVGNMVRMLALAKFYRVLGAMYAAGTPISQAMNHAADASGNWFLTKRLRRASPLVAQGMQLSAALEATRVLPPMALDMISTGEQTGNIDEMLDKVAEYTENEAEVGVIQSTVVLGILLVLCVAAYIGSFVIHFWVGTYQNMSE
jgi:type II secretory pathway component PulF